MEKEINTNEEELKNEDIVAEDEVIEDTETQENDEIEFVEDEKEEEDELAILKDKLLRKEAEFRNLKARSAEDYSKAHTNGVIDAVSSLIETLDYMNMAIAHVDFESGNVDATARGVQMVVNIFEQKLSDLKVSEIKCDGIADHNFHEAIDTDLVEGMDEDQIIAVIKKGYVLGDKVIRHAKVKVNKK